MNDRNRNTTVSIHDFRRSFALAMFWSGTDIFMLAKLMGHESTAVLSHYLKLTDTFVRGTHRKASPIDQLA